MSEAITFDTHRLAAKADVWAIKADMQVVRADMQAIKAELLNWMIGAMTTHAAFIAALVWYLFTSVSGG